MSLKNFLGQLKQLLFSTECGINSNFRFSQSEINEILANAKKGNLKYFETLAKIQQLSFFDVSYLMLSVELDENKIALIVEASRMYDSKEFCAHGQTFSDFIFRVCANINLLSENNLDVFKELVRTKNELYDFTNALKNPARAQKMSNRKAAYVFQTVFVD